MKRSPKPAKGESILTREVLRRILLIIGAFLLTIAILEVSVRAGGETDADGQFTFLSYTLPPYVLPLNEIRPEMEEYLNNKDQANFIPDPETGWVHRPDAILYDGLFTINSLSMRARREYDRQPAEDSLRIALFGDSYVASDEVNNEEAWGYILEKLLMEAGVNAEVLNFGVGGYGMGQAFLRWQKQGKDFSPDIVIFVFQPENLDRNVNVFRLLYVQGGVVYSKPRFILEGESLALINSPALPPEEIIDAFENFDSHPLAAFEAYYRGRGVSSALWNISKLAGLVYVALENLESKLSPEQIYGPDSERGRLGKAIVEAFAADVADEGASFIVMHLPRYDHFRQFHDGKPLPWRFLLDHFEDEYHFINAEDFLGEEYTGDSYYKPYRHYGPEINLKIAEAVAAELLACIRDRICASAGLEEITSARQ